MAATSHDPETARAAALAGEIRVLVGKVNRRLREQSHQKDLTGAQKSVLVRLDRNGPATVTSLAREEGVRPQSMGATIAALEAAGFISGAPDPNDGRRTILSLTASCRDWITTSRAAREDWLFRTLLSNLTAVEREQLANSLSLLGRLIDP
jgi:DNA-binding MarR family transcriptional regulator